MSLDKEERSQLIARWLDVEQEERKPKDTLALGRFGLSTKETEGDGKVIRADARGGQDRASYREKSQKGFGGQPPVKTPA